MIRLTILSLLLVIAMNLGAAVGCDLNDPDRDVKRLFPESTGFATYYKSVAGSGGKALLTRIETRLGDKFTGMYETIDVAYTIYEIKKGKDRIGWIHGVNQKGKHGGIQVFLVLDNKYTIKDIYFQRFASRSSAKLKERSFTQKFKGLSLTELMSWNVSQGKGTGKMESFVAPKPDSESDFRAVMRAIKKNLILMDAFFPLKESN